VLRLKRCERKSIENQRLSQSILAKFNWETTFCEHYRSIFNHCELWRDRPAKLSNSAK